MSYQVQKLSNVGGDVLLSKSLEGNPSKEDLREVSARELGEGDAAIKGLWEKREFCRWHLQMKKGERDKGGIQ